jgi:hypothetical protein
MRGCGTPGAPATAPRFADGRTACAEASTARSREGYGLGGEQADFFVTILAVDRKLDIGPPTAAHGRYGTACRSRRRPSRNTTGQPDHRRGEREAKQVVWRGVGTGRLRRERRGGSVRLRRVYEVVDEVLADFPPQRK